MKTLLAGWFSFEEGNATAGDLLAGDLTCEWLEQAGCSYDIALAPPFRGGVDWRSVDPQKYSNVVFVCGPFQNYKRESEFLVRFARCKIIGLDVSMPIPLDVWNPFDILLERDSSVGTQPDIVFLSRQPRVPVVGVILVEPYREGTTQVADAAIHRLVKSREMAVVTIDTRLDTNSTGLRSSAEIESLIARMDVVVTTRLHGTVLALKNGVPVVAIDPEVGGAKIRRQAETIGWPVVFNVDTLTDETLQGAFDYCLTEDAQVKARECYQQAMKTVQELRDQFISVLGCPDESQRPSSVHGRRWLQDQWQGNNFEEHNLLQVWKLQNTLLKERQKTRRLRKQIQRLSQQLQNAPDSRIQRLFGKLGHIRAKVIKK